jgi:hypothetical protein
LETHVLFIDYEKAFDNVDRQKLFQILEGELIPDTLLQEIVHIQTPNIITIKINTEPSQQGSETRLSAFTNIIQHTHGRHFKLLASSE